VLHDRIDIASARFLNTLANWLTGLPDTNVTTFLEGGLLIVRKSFFNQAPRVTSVQQSYRGDGKLVGRIGAIDLEGDALTYSVVDNPKFGTVELTANGGYVYTPNPDYGGSDVFTVKVAPARRSFDLLNLFADGSEVTQIQVGSPDSTTAGSPVEKRRNSADLAVYLPSAAGHITVKKAFGIDRYTGTVTLTGIAPGTNLSWMDAVGNLGQISIDDFATVHWRDFKNKAEQSGGSVDLSISYAAADGTATGLILSQVSVRKDAAGQYVFTGELGSDPVSKPDAVDSWDVLGPSFKPKYEAFRQAYNIGQPAKFTTVDVDFTQAALFADTYTALSYQQSGMYALDHPAGQQSENADQTATPATSEPATSEAMPVVGSAKAVGSSVAGVTASIPLGHSFVVARDDGSVELWTDGKRTQLHDSGWDSPVEYLLDYSRPLKDAQGNTLSTSFTGNIAGTTLTVTTLGLGSTVVVGQEITGAGVAPGTIITKFIPKFAQCDKGASNCTEGQGGAAGGPGTYEVSISQTVASTTTKFTQSPPAIAPGFIVGLQNGSVQLWSATGEQASTTNGGWLELHDAGWASALTAMSTCGEGIVVGLANGAVQKWDGPGTNPAPETWKDNWTELSDGNWGGTLRYPVSALVEYDHGIVVGFGAKKSENDGQIYYNGQVEFWGPTSHGANPTFGWTELNNIGGSSVTAMTTYGKGVAVGMTDGSVRYWDGSVATHSGWTELHDAGWLNPVTTLLATGKDGLVVGLGGSGAVEYHTGFDSNTNWTEVHGNGWNSPVTQMKPYVWTSQSSLESGVVIGLGNGSVQLWNGKTEESRLRELHSAGWDSKVVSMVPYRQYVTDPISGKPLTLDGIVVGLENGALEEFDGVYRWDKDFFGAGSWIEIFGPSYNQASETLAEDGLLKKAVDFGKAMAKTGGGDWGTPNSIGSAGDPIFGLSFFKPPCAAHNSCDVDGTFLPIASYIPTSLAKKTLSAPSGEASVNFGLDVNAMAYGYAFMPAGISKLVPGLWSVATLVAVEAGPSMTVKVGGGGTINAPAENLFNYQWFTPGPLGFDTIAVDVGSNASLNATFVGASDTLNAHVYMVPGMLFTFNTQSSQDDVQFGFNAYPDIEYSDFKKVSGISVTPTVTPYITTSYGLFAPDSYPIIGGWSLFKLSGGFENPVSATLAYDTNRGGSVTLKSTGYLTAHAGILEAITDLISWDGKAKVYDVDKTLV
jgi:hypothetical protein